VHVYLLYEVVCVLWVFKKNQIRYNLMCVQAYNYVTMCFLCKRHLLVHACFLCVVVCVFNFSFNSNQIKVTDCISLTYWLEITKLEQLMRETYDLTYVTYLTYSRLYRALFLAQ